MKRLANRGLSLLSLALFVLMVSTGYAQDSKDAPRAEASKTEEAPLTLREKQLLDRLAQIEQRLAALETKERTSITSGAPVSSVGPVAQAAIEPTTNAPAPPALKESPSVPAILAGTTLNFNFDGYYGFNFNRPVGRINLLRAYDPLSNSFTLSQAGIIVERAPEIPAGKRLGLRVDLLFGQASESLGGSPLNEPRPQVYRNIFQAYGTYVVPVGSGLTVDFGKWASSLGYEGTYTKDQLNYSRSLLFTALPFYHLGFRASYTLNSKVALQYWLVNGLNQSEDFNGFKSNAFLITLKPAKTLSWNLNYYEGREQPNLVPSLNPGIPSLPTQPGLSTTVVRPTPRGREHIIDTTLAWNVSPKLLLAGEGDYFINRVFENSAPSRLSGVAGYLQYQFVPAFSLAGRFEYVSDRGGLLSGATQALKEGTLTATYQVLEGFQLRGEFRRDFCNQPFFLTHRPNALKREQDTLTLGLIWWFGAKHGAW